MIDIPGIRVPDSKRESANMIGLLGRIVDGSVSSIHKTAADGYSSFLLYSRPLVKLSLDNDKCGSDFHGNADRLATLQIDKGPVRFGGGQQGGVARADDPVAP